ncbi:MAG: glycosyltransferase [Chloroflexi bacterium]|nr:glycosyltransferase [Chloroflexota bacterium]
MVSHNSAEWLPNCLPPFLSDDAANCDSDAAPHPVYVVDNASTDGSVAVVERRFPAVVVVKSLQNLGFAGGANIGIRASNTDVVVIMNPDVTVNPATLASLATALSGDPRAAIAGGKLLYPDGRTIQHAGGSLSYPLALADHYGYGAEDRGQHDQAREVDYVTGAVIAVKRSALEEIGSFDEGFYPAYFEEVDLCFRARRAGYKVLYVPQAVAIHHESATTGKNTPQYYRYYHRNRVRFVLKHYSDERLAHDFLPAERVWLRQLGSEGELAALREAYADNLAVLEDRADFIANPANVAPLPTSRCKVETLRVLEGSVEEILAAGKSQVAPSRDGLAALGLRCRLVEPPFVSGAPLVGPLIVRFRRVWNWMATKWYVRPLIQQQSEFNALVVEALREQRAAIDEALREQRTAIDEALREQEARLAESLREQQAVTLSAVESERSIVGLRKDLALLEHRLQRMEDRLADLQRLLAASGSEPDSRQR